MIFRAICWKPAGSGLKPASAKSTQGIKRDEKIDSLGYRCASASEKTWRGDQDEEANGGSDDRQGNIIVLCIHFVSRLAFVMQVEPRCRCCVVVDL